MAKSGDWGEKDLREAALDYHRWPTPGKLAVTATKPLATQHDLALAYSPGVAAACDSIVADEREAYALTAKANLVAVITNGSAVLGLGAIGPLAAKPVMEGKAVLFKKFAGIDVFDIEIDESDPERLADIIAALAPSFGAINLEDIKAPECFAVEQRLRERLGIPVFHDDQHGTAVVAAAALLNGLRVVEKKIDEIALVSTGGGAAGIACLDLLVRMGLRRDNVMLVDVHGVVYQGRAEDMNPYKERYARQTPARGLNQVIAGADVFLGLSAPGVLKPEMVARMAERPLILALANPVPEILPEEARAVRADAVIATGRSDYANQVNNVLCFPFLFRGALDVGASTINEDMKLACVNAIAGLAMAESSEIVARAYGGEELKFGPDYLLPKPFDPRLIGEIAPAVARAAMESGVATRPIEDFNAYQERLSGFVFRSGLLMKPVFEQARRNRKRIVYAEGEDKRVLRAAQVLIDQGLARPILIGREQVIARRIETLALRLRLGEDFEWIDPQDDSRCEPYGSLYHDLMEGRGVSPRAAREIVRTNTTALAALMVRAGEAEAMICGTDRDYEWHLRHVLDVIGRREGVRDVSALSVLILPKGTFFLCDTFVTPEPSAEEIAEMTVLSAEQIRRFGIAPKVALLSHSNFGAAKTASAEKMREAKRLLRRRAPELEVEGEMHADVALDEAIRARVFPDSALKGQANLLVMPNLDAANIAFNMVKALGDGLPVGPILVGTARPAHIVTPSVTARGIVNISALAAVGAQLQDAEAREQGGGDTPPE